MDTEARHYDARQFLRDELYRRSQKNSAYSLRAFSRSLGLNHTTLSLFLNGRRPLSKKTAQLISEKLALNPQQSEHFVKSSNPEQTKPVPHSGTSVPSNEFQKISLDVFHYISDWVHYAVLSLLEISDSRFEERWLARRLNINRNHAKSVMERLMSLGLVDKSKGRWRQSGKGIKIENSVSTSATRAFHSGLLDKAKESLEADPFALRDFSSVTFAMDPQDIPYARERIKEFRRTLMKDLETRNKPKEVYNLTVQIFPVSKEIKK